MKFKERNPRESWGNKFDVILCCKNNMNNTILRDIAFQRLLRPASQKLKIFILVASSCLDIRIISNANDHIWSYSLKKWTFAIRKFKTSSFLFWYEKRIY